jgi:hypothetical protein
MLKIGQSWLKIVVKLRFKEELWDEQKLTHVMLGLNICDF